MDIDDNVPAEEAAATQNLVDELGALIDEIERHPYNVRLLRRQVDLMVQLGMMDEATSAVESLFDIAFLGESLWTKFLDAKIQHTTEINLETFADILELFDQAEREYSSAAIYKRHVEFLVALSQHSIDSEQATYGELSGDADVSAQLEHEAVRGMVWAIVDAASGLLGQSQVVWQAAMDWELAVLGSSVDDNKKEQMQRVHELYLTRLQVPHATHEATSSAYSTFLSEHCPEEYENRMVQVTEASQLAKKKLSEKRRGRTREDFEDQLASHDSATHLSVLAAYLDWETDPMTKNPKYKHGPRQDPLFVRAIFERTLLAYSKAAAAAEEASFNADAAAVEGQSASMVETANAYKTAEALMWARYVDYVDEDKSSDKEIKVSEVLERAVKGCPTSGELWSRRLIALERNNEIPAIETSVEKATNIITGNQQPVSVLVDVLSCHAAILHRRFRSIEPTLEHPVFVNLTTALETVLHHYKDGDSSLRLEKFFIAWAENAAPELLPGVLAVLDQPIKSRLSSYQRVILVAQAQARTEDFEATRATYQKSIARTDLDWPEAVYDAFILFENVHGTVDTVVDARRRIDKEQAKVNRRRQQEAEKQQTAATEQYRLAAEAYSAAAPEVSAVADAEAAEDVAVPIAAEQQAHDTAAAPATGNNVTEPASHIKRDRENTTILVTGLKKGTTVERVQQFFENWGKVRECTILPADDDRDTEVALVEFRFADALPGVLEKDRRKLDGNDIHVAMLWRSTLFVTNFGRGTDDAALRKLFSQYGKILQTRWPSRKFADSRRFCYITMESPAAAQEALVLHNFKPDGGEFPMTVVISDPSAKKKRSDESNSTLFVGGLNSKTTENALHQLFAKYGSIVGINLGWDPVNRVCKGFAFVEMSSQPHCSSGLKYLTSIITVPDANVADADQEQDEARAAITGVDGTQYHNRRLKVTISDPNHSNKKRAPRPPPNSTPFASAASGSNAREEAADRRSRQLCLYDLPPNTQEGLLQQELEKIVAVRRLEVFAASNEALVELESQADAGLLLMKPFVFNDVTIRVGEQGGRRQAEPPTKGANTAATAASAAPTSSLAFQPRPRAQKGAKAVRGAYVPPKAAAATAPAAPPTGSGQDAFRAFMTATNEQRKDKLQEKQHATSGAQAAETAAGDSPAASSSGQKHPLEDAEGDEGSEAKRAKTSK